MMTPTDTAALRTVMEEATPEEALKALEEAAPDLLDKADAYVRVMALLDGAHVLPQSQVHQALAIPGKPVEALKALEDADDDLLDELDQLRGQVARVEEVIGSGTFEVPTHDFGLINVVDIESLMEALAIPAGPKAGERMTTQPSTEVPTCGSCGRKRTPQDAYDYNPLQVIMRQPLGWYSGDDSEVCPECMTTLMSGGKR